MDTTPLSVYDEVRKALQAFQEGYTCRDVTRLDEFMALFVPEAEIEIIGTGGEKPGEDEWTLNRKSTARLIEEDWNYWGDVRLDIDQARIHVKGDVAWLSVPATVTRTLNPAQSFQNYVDYIKFVINEEQGKSAEEKVLDIVRGGTNTVFEAQRGATYIWPFRFTAVLVRTGVDWRFHQVQFSFPTTRFPDVRYSSPNGTGG